MLKLLLLLLAALSLPTDHHCLGCARVLLVGNPKRPQKAAVVSRGQVSRGPMPRRPVSHNDNKGEAVGLTVTVGVTERE